MKSIYKFTPYEKLKIETTLSKDEVVKRLSATIDSTGSTRNWFTGINSSNLYFGGTLSETGFQIRRNISYKNSFLPEIEGKIEALRFGCTIELKLKLNILAMIIGSVWFLGMLIASIGVLSVYFTSAPADKDMGMFIPVFMIIVGAPFFIGFFKYESNKARRFLKELLDASEVNG